MENILLSALSHLPETCVVIDAVDECGESLQVTKWLRGLMTAEVKGHHFLVTGRRELDIEHDLRSISRDRTIHVDASIEADIKRYILSTMADNPYLSHTDQTQNIQQSLQRGADGMYTFYILLLFP